MNVYFSIAGNNVWWFGQMEKTFLNKIAGMLLARRQMKKTPVNSHLLIAFIFLLLGATAQAQTAPNINVDESKVPSYILPNPLQRPDGVIIKTTAEWEQKQRPHLLQLFANHMYGRIPGRPKAQWTTLRSVDSMALNGTAIRKQVRMYFSDSDSTASMDILLYLPKKRSGKVPVFIGLNFGGNHTVQADTGICLSTRWISDNEAYKTVNHKATEASRGVQARRWPVEQLIQSGYGLATVYYGDLEPDHQEGWKTGIRSTLQNSLQIKPEEWGAISAWAWGLSRMADYLTTEPAVNARAIIVTGHSRLGKAALWAAANDKRFAMVVSNESGEGGAALARRWFGETTERLNTNFPHWFVPAFQQYNHRPKTLPFDQHFLLALLAPRPLYVASAEEDLWADPRGEFLGAKGAEPVYALFGKRGLGVPEMPAANVPVGETIRYHVRGGKHDMLPYDWAQYIRFADEYFKR